MVNPTLLPAVTYNFPDKLRITEHFFEVPLNYQKREGRKIEIFGRSVTRRETPITPLTEDEAIKKSQKPWIVYLQGGPGLSCSSPQNQSITHTLVDRGYQIFYLDQRGTGLSTCITADTLRQEGDVNDQAEYMKLFRADNIVRDCETIRKQLTATYPEDQKKWSLIGQSFGGYCTFTYLSIAPEGVKEAFVLGGVPPVGKPVDDVYAATFRKVTKRNKAYFEKYPNDTASLHKLLDFLAERPVKLPDGGLLTPQRLLGMGLYFGFHGGIDIVHEIIFRLSTDLRQWGSFTRPTLSMVEKLPFGGFDNQVIYAVLHEPLYCSNDPATSTSNWSAQRVGASIPEFEWLDKPDDYFRINNLQSLDKPVYFSGEMIFPHMFEAYPELASLRPVAEILAKTSDWHTNPYDEEQLSKNEVPVYAAVYMEDMYVDFNLSQETIQKTPNVKQFITNTMYHDAISNNTEKVLQELFKLRDDCID